MVATLRFPSRKVPTVSLDHSHGRLVKVDWPKVVRELREVGFSQDDIANRMSFFGVPAHRSTISLLEKGRTNDPFYSTGAALLCVSIAVLGEPE